MRSIALPLLLIALFAWLIVNDTLRGSASSSIARAAEEDDSEATPVETAAVPEQAQGEAGFAPTEESEDEYDPDKPLIDWRGESPHWVPGQEFAAVKDAPFIGSAECVLCHEELKTDFLHTAHARTLLDDKAGLDQQGCEMCHGAGGAHAVLRSRGAIFAFDWQDPQATNDICLRCHTWLTSDHEWDRTTHAKAGLTCTQCHDPHQNQRVKQERFLLLEQQDRLCAECHRDAANDFMRFSHHPVQLGTDVEPGAAAMHCTSCHDVHAGKERAMLPTRRVSDLCVTCHADKAGPFRFEHLSNQEGLGRGCMECHAQHGSHSETLLVADGRALCAQCHTDREDHYQPLTCWTTGCHTDVHGSNRSFMLFGDRE
jgi:DmsE family decaheme c-type cytochrome